MMNWCKMLELGLGEDSWETMVIREILVEISVGELNLEEGIHENQNPISLVSGAWRIINPSQSSM